MFGEATFHADNDKMAFTMQIKDQEIYSTIFVRPQWTFTRDIKWLNTVNRFKSNGVKRRRKRMNRTKIK